MTDREKQANFQFILIFIALFTLFEVSYFFIPIEYLNNKIYPLLITEPCSAIINLISGNTNVIARNSFIQSSTANLQIVRGCDGSGVLFLLLAAVLAFRVNIKYKLIGVIGGILFVYVINTIRIVFIYFIVSEHNEYFVEFHSLIAPTIIIILTSIAFIVWANWSYEHLKAKPE